MVDTTEPVPSDPIGVRRRALKAAVWAELLEYAITMDEQVIEAAHRMGLTWADVAHVAGEVAEVCENKAYNYSVRRDTGNVVGHILAVRPGRIVACPEVDETGSPVGAIPVPCQRA